MFQQNYSSQINNTLSSTFNQSLPYTLVYQAERDMSVSQSIQIAFNDPDSYQTISISQKNIQYNNHLQSNSNTNATPQSQTYHKQYFNPRSHMEIRHSYLTKLMSRGIMTQKPRRRYRHLFVFDWDDTLLCTTYLNHFKFSQLRQKDYQMLFTIDNYVCKILKSCMIKGDVSIITNAAKGWVEYSSQKFLPKTFEYILKEKIPIISARSQYADQFPNQIKKWKVSAFQKLNSQQNNHLITNIICIGDSTIQMEAGQILASSFQKSLLKTVKFRQNPRIQQLLKQQQLLDKKLQQIVNTAKNLTIRLQRKSNK